MRGPSWHESDVKRLRKLYPVLPLKVVSRRLNRTVSAVKTAAHRYGITKGRKYWRKAELKIVRQLYTDRHTEEIAKLLNRSRRSVYQAANKMGLKKSREFLKSDGYKGRLKSGTGERFRFKKGHVPANKGLRRPGYSPGRMKETQFKKGQRSGVAAKVWRPIGTIVADPEGYLRIKVRERTSYGEEPGWHPNVWPLLSHHVWEKHKGPVPPKHMVVFKDRDRNNCAFENLELISMAENARRNGMWNILPRELAEAIQLNGVLKRKLRRQHGEEQGNRSQRSSV